MLEMMVFQQEKLITQALPLTLSGVASMAYSDYVNSQMDFCDEIYGTNRVNVGNVGFSAGWVEYTNIAVSPVDSQPYVAYNDGGNFCKKL